MFASIRAVAALTGVLAMHLALAGAASSAPVTGDGPPRSADEELLRMGREIPGFGGLFYDAAGDPTVYLRDVRDRAALSSLKSLGKAVRVRQGEFEFAQLVEWRDALGPALALPGVVYLDADEARNRVVIGLDATSPEKDFNRGRLERELLSAGVPRRAVLLVDSAPIEPLAAVNLQSKVRPVPGGVQIVFSHFACTLGFNATRNRVAGFVINSHCTGTRGEVDGMTYSQSVPAGGTIGTEIADPAFFTDPPCPPERRCRYSDSAFAKYGKPRNGALGKIARPASGDPDQGTLFLNPASARFTISGRNGSPLTGEIVHKVGRTTGWTYGTVIGTCVGTNTSGTDVSLLCQTRVRGGVGAGDSGSPVFSRIGAGVNVRLVGILWGGSTNALGETEFVFSPLDNIEEELGPLKVN